MAEKKKWTLIDTLIVILVIVAAVGGYKMFGSKTASKGTDNTVKAVVLIASQEQGLADAMNVGDDVTVSLTEKDSGKLVDLEVKPAETMVYDSINGAYYNTTLEGKIDIYATVEMDVSETDYAFTAGSTIVKVGTRIPFRGKGYATEGYIINLEEKE